MPFTPNTVPTYAQAPLDLAPVTLPATAKTVFTDTSNAQLLLATVAVGRKATFARIYAQPVANLTAGRLMLFKSNDGGSTARMVKDVAHASLTVSTTAEGAEIDFGYTEADPLIVEEGWSLYVASAVAQASGAAIVAGRGKIF